MIKLLCNIFEIIEGRDINFTVLYNLDNEGINTKHKISIKIMDLWEIEKENYTTDDWFIPSE